MADVVIPAHNEESRIASVLEAVKGAPGVDRIIVVADACVDETATMAERYAEVFPITAKDKGAALSVGIGEVTSDTLLTLDGDLEGLLPEHIEGMLIAPPEGGQVVGLVDNDLTRWVRLGLPPISGQRRLPTAFAKQIPLIGAGYRSELIIDAWVGRHNLPWRNYHLNGVTNPSRAIPHPLQWTAMWWELFWQGVQASPDLVKYLRCPH
jgi:glycosyltransferase involved in cell wall biosynthesis